MTERGEKLYGSSVKCMTRRIIAVAALNEKAWFAPGTSSLTPAVMYRPSPSNYPRCNNPRVPFSSNQERVFMTRYGLVRSSSRPCSLSSVRQRLQTIASLPLLGVALLLSAPGRAGTIDPGVAAADPADEATVRAADLGPRRTDRLAGAGQSGRGTCDAGKHCLRD